MVRKTRCQVSRVRHGDGWRSNSRYPTSRPNCILHMTLLMPMHKLWHAPSRGAGKTTSNDVARHQTTLQGFPCSCVGSHHRFRLLCVCNPGSGSLLLLDCFDCFDCFGGFFGSTNLTRILIDRRSLRFSLASFS